MVNAIKRFNFIDSTIPVEHQSAQIEFEQQSRTELR